LPRAFIQEAFGRVCKASMAGITRNHHHTEGM